MKPQVDLFDSFFGLNTLKFDNWWQNFEPLFYVGFLQLLLLHIKSRRTLPVSPELLALEYKWLTWKNRDTAMAICFTFSTGVLSITGFHNLGKSLSLLWYFFIILIQKNFPLSKHSSTSPLTSLHLFRLLSSTWSKMPSAKWGNLLHKFSIVQIGNLGFGFKIQRNYFEIRKLEAFFPGQRY